MGRAPPRPLPVRVFVPTPPYGAIRPTEAWVLAYLLVAVLDLVAEGLHARVAAFVGSLLAMPLLIALLRASDRRGGRLHRLVTVALVLSWLGDWLGDLVAPTVVVKLGFFFVAHVGYVLAFWPFRRRSALHRPRALVTYLVLVGALVTWIAPQSGRLAVPVVLYATVLASMAVLSTGVNRLAGTGGAIFVVSDLAIAVTSFVTSADFRQAELVIMGTYLPAQLLITLGVVRAAGSTQPAAARPLVNRRRRSSRVHR